MPEEELIAERRRKVDELAALGVPSYGVDFGPEATLGEALTRLTAFEREAGPAPDGGPPREGPAVAVAGRVVQLRLQGGVCFAHVEDEEDRLQVWIPRDRVGPATWEVVRRLDLGDIVGVRGRLTRTRRGEPSVLADEVVLLVKALRPPPEK